MRTRTGLVVMALCAAVAAAPATAGAQEPAGLTQVVPVTGKSKSGKQFTGSYAIDRFRTSNGKLVAVGTLRGRLGQRPPLQRRSRRSRMPARSSTWSSGRSTWTCSDS